MKKLLTFLSCTLIIGNTQLGAMKRNRSHITASPAPAQALWLPTEIITKIAASCDPKTRANWSMSSKLYDHLAVIKNNPAIVDQPEFEIKQKNRLYYLFYGCIHTIKNLVIKALQKFDQYSYLDMRTLTYVKHFITKLTHNDTTPLLPDYPAIATVIDKESTMLHWAINEDLTISLIKLLLQHFPININAQDVFTKDTPLHRAIHNHNIEMVKILLAYPTIGLTIPNDKEHTALDSARFAQQQLADKSLELSKKEYIGSSWIKKVTEHNKRVLKNTTIIKLLMRAHGWDL